MTRGVRIKNGIAFVLEARYPDTHNTEAAEMAADHVERLKDAGKRAFFVRYSDGSYGVFSHAE